MIARQGLERLTEMMTRFGAELESSQGVAAELGRATGSLVEIIRTLAGRLEARTAETGGNHAEG